MITAYPPDLFNSQRLLFEETRAVAEADRVDVPEELYENGWAVLDGIAGHDEAVARQESLIASLDQDRLPFQARFADRIRLGKADLIPVCDDVVSTSFQVLHFDMGMPFVEGREQMLVTHVGIYLPATTSHTVTARTRLLPLSGALADRRLRVDEIERLLVAYAKSHGDGWADCNTFRLACLVRIIDALAETPELADEIDKTVGQWFFEGHQLDARSAHAQELAYCARHGVDIGGREHEVALEPGQLLFVDNTRVVHGRVGKRRAREVFNFMFGVPSIDDADVALLRRHICEMLAVG